MSLARRSRILAGLAILLLLLSSGRPALAQTGGGLQASISADPSAAAAGQPVFFTYTVPPSSSPSGLTTTVVDFGDGQTIDGGSVAPAEPVIGDAIHVYTAPGTYTVTLTAQAPDGRTGSATTVVTVADRPQPPVVELRASPTAAQAGQPVSFTYSATVASAGVSIASMTIDYGDGNVASLAAASGTVSHTYAGAGTYAVLLTAVDSSGLPAAASAVIQVTG